MKKLIIILLFPFVMLSQDRVIGFVYQDVSLAVLKDDYGNSPFTLNSLTGVELQGSQGKQGFFNLGINYEYADLNGGEYNRGAIQAGYTFNNLIIEDTEISIGLNWGGITRGSSSKVTHSLGMYGDVTYYITEDVGVVFIGQFVDRSDLDRMWGTDVIRFSFLAGLKLTIFNKQFRK